MPFKSLVSAVQDRMSRKDKSDRSSSPSVTVTDADETTQPSSDTAGRAISRGSSYQSSYTRRTARPSPSPARHTSDSPHTNDNSRSGASPASRPRPKRPLRIQVPLYIYPAPEAWEPLFTALTTHPTLNFDIIVNPFNGPGPSPLPDENYTAQITRLRQFPNVTLYGYIHIKWCERSLEDARADIDAYAHWNTASAAPGAGFDIRVDGVFVDEAPWHVRNKDYMVGVYESVRETLPGKALVWTNPGCPISREYYAYADRVTAFESGYKEWVERKGLEKWFDGGASERRKSTVMVHSCPRGKVKEVLDLCRAEKIDGVFITDTGGYESWGRGWAEWVKIVADEIEATS